MTRQPGWSTPGEPDRDVSGGFPPAPPPPPPNPSTPPNPGQWGAPPPPPGGWDGGWNPPPAPGQHPGQANPWGAGPGTPWGRAVPRPGIVPLRPLSMGEIYDGAFQSIRRNPRTMVGIAALVTVVTTLIGLLPQAAALTALGGNTFSATSDTASASEVLDEAVSSFGAAIGATLLPALLQVVAIFLVTGLLIVSVSEAVIGRKVAPGALWRRVRPRVLPLLGLLLIEIVAFVALLALLLLPGGLVLIGNQVAGIVLLAVGALIWLVIAFALYTALWAVAAPALLLEGLSPVAALRRSRRLAGRSFWRVLGIMLLTAILVAILQGVITFPFAIASAVPTFLAEDGTPGFVGNLISLTIQGVGTILGTAVFAPFSAAVTTLLYIDLRMRFEGLDVELIRAGEAA